MPTLGMPSYSFQYKLLHGGGGAGTRTIANLNFKMNENDDGITPQAWYQFMTNVTNALGIGFEGITSKVIETRLYTETGGE